MPIVNLSSVTFTDPEVANVNVAIAKLKEIIAPKATNLTTKERQQYGSIAEQNKLLVQKIMAYAESNAEIVPAHTDFAELNRDNTARNQLEKWETALHLLLNNIENTKTLLDFDVYQSCLTIYRNVRYMAGEDIAGMSAIYADLQQFFPGGRPTADATTAGVASK